MTSSKPSLLTRLGYAVLVALCVVACGLILLLPSESLIADLVYRAF